MKKALAISVYSVCCSLVIATLFLLMTPVTARAASCSASCSGGSVSVSGTSCTCVDYSGCVYHTQQGGNYAYFNMCKP
ncbi:MAG: hypothetical protein V7641_1704 [Blastocatellia bacterium]